jgi:hypothetical protein
MVDCVAGNDDLSRAENTQRRCGIAYWNLTLYISWPNGPTAPHICAGLERRWGPACPLPGQCSCRCLHLWGGWIPPITTSMCACRGLRSEVGSICSAGRSHAMRGIAPHARSVHMVCPASRMVECRSASAVGWARHSRAVAVRRG